MGLVCAALYIVISIGSIRTPKELVEYIFYSEQKTTAICSVIMLVCIIICCCIMPRLLKFLLGWLTAGMGVGWWTSGLMLCGIFNPTLFIITSIILFAAGVVCQTLGYDIKLFLWIGLGPFTQKYSTSKHYNVEVPGQTVVVVQQQTV